MRSKSVIGSKGGAYGRLSTVFLVNQGSRDSGMVSEDVQRDSEVWCSDGNLLIVAEHTCFRVHRSMISRHSNTFLDLVQPQSVVQEDVPEGCSVVRASDSAHDLKHLFRILYDGYE